MLDLNMLIGLYERTTQGTWIHVGGFVEHEDDNTPDICSCRASDLNQQSLLNYRPNVEVENARFISEMHNLFPEICSELKRARSDVEKKQTLRPKCGRNAELANIKKEKKQLLAKLEAAEKSAKRSSEAAESFKRERDKLFDEVREAEVSLREHKLLLKSVQEERDKLASITKEKMLAKVSEAEAVIARYERLKKEEREKPYWHLKKERDEFIVAAESWAARARRLEELNTVLEKENTQFRLELSKKATGGSEK